LAAGLWWAVPRRGMIGAIAVVVAISVFENVWIVGRVARLLKADSSHWSQLKDFLRLAIAAAAAALCVAASRALLSSLSPLLTLAATAPVFAALYSAFVWISGVPTLEEKASLLRLLRGFRKRGLSLRSLFLTPAEAADGSREIEKQDPD